MELELSGQWWMGQNIHTLHHHEVPAAEVGHWVKLSNLLCGHP